MSMEERTNEELPEVHVADEGTRCGRFVAKDGEEDLYCDLAEGHEGACSAPVRDVEL